MPEIGDLYAIHQKSGHVYKMVKHDDTNIFLERFLKYVPESGKYKKGDGFASKVSFGRFRNVFRVLNAQELETLPKQTEEEKQKESEESNVVYEPTERDDFNRLILSPTIVDTIMTGIKKIQMRKELDETWGLEEIRPQKGRLAMNFYGPPGTGKTMAARATAKQLNKKILQVDYASMISKWVGDTAKHIRQAFKDASKNEAILFFDEADSMLSKRVEHQDGDHSNSINQNRNVLMQELDRFDSIVIFATNFFKNYDEALLRRISQHIKFELPDEKSRIKILDIKIPKKAKENGKLGKDIDIVYIAKITEGFSGSDLENIIANAIEVCATNNKILMQEDLMKETLKIKDSKQSHGTGPRKMMGIHGSI